MTSIAPGDRRRRIPAVVPVALASLAAVALAALVASAAVAAGPPYPAPETGVRVYDNADILSPDVEGAAQSTIDAIEARTGAQVVVYTQDVESGRSTDEADADARALMDEWGVGRKGFDDGLVILFDMYPGREHGQVILYGGPGFRATYLDNGEKQRIFDEEMLPRLKAGDFDGALLAALDKVDAATTPQHAAALERARQIDAVAGLIVAPLLALVIVGSMLVHWRQVGRDPVYADDPSVLMAGPPEGLTPATAVVVMDGQPVRRALTAAMLDLASRGLIAFREEHGILGTHQRVGIELQPPEPDAQTRARQLRNAARPLGPAEQVAETGLLMVPHDDTGYIDPEHLLSFSSTVTAFDQTLESEAVKSGWYGERPSKVMARWTARGIGVGVLGGIGIYLGVNIPSNGLLFIGIALLVSGILIVLIGRAMPAVTRDGAMVRAMLSAYRRTLKQTMDQVRSMDEVVAKAGLPWLETPDQAVVWGTALGLHHEIEEVLARSTEDEREGRIAGGSAWTPTWYSSTGGGLFGGSGLAAGGFAGAGAGSGGMFSSSAVPDLGGMMSALGSIGNAPSSSGSGGFGGGGSGGGGGGSGGGF